MTTNPPTKKTTKGDDTIKCPRCGAIYNGPRGVLGLCLPCIEFPSCFICGEIVVPVVDGIRKISMTNPPGAYCPKCDKLTPDEKENLVKVNQKFSDPVNKPAKQETERSQYNKRLWVAARALYDKDAERKVANTIKKRYSKESTKDLTDDQFKELAVGVETYAKAQGKMK